jgi:hypothetical protein
VPDDCSRELADDVRRVAHRVRILQPIDDGSGVDDRTEILVEEQPTAGARQPTEGERSLCAEPTSMPLARDDVAAVARHVCEVADVRAHGERVGRWRRRVEEDVEMQARAAAAREGERAQPELEAHREQAHRERAHVALVSVPVEVEEEVGGAATGAGVFALRALTAARETTERVDADGRFTE